MTQPDEIKMIVFDVDGVLTDGSIIVDDLGIESKRFHVRDGFAIASAIRLGMKIGVLSGRSTRAVTLRMTELKIPYMIQGCKDKAIGIEDICKQAEVGLHETAYVGDDLIDLPALVRVGFPATVADAVEEVKAEASLVTLAPGGRGAAREVIEHILKAQGKWDELVESYGI